MNLNQPFKFKIKKYKDKRGYLSEIFSKKKIKLNFNHSIISVSKKNVVRGLHFRIKPEYKILYMFKGQIDDYCINLKTKKKYKFKLKDNDCLLIPPGYAHGFCVLSDRAILHYAATKIYDPKNSSGLIWNDKTVKIKWPIKKPIISNRDKNFKNINELIQHNELPQK